SSYICGAEARQLRRCRAQRQLVVLGPQEVAEQGIGGVDADAPVHLLGRRRDARTRLGRPEFRDGGLAPRRPTLLEQPCGLPHVHRMASTSMKASAIRCWTAWK